MGGGNVSNNVGNIVAFVYSCCKHSHFNTVQKSLIREHFAYPNLESLNMNLGEDLIFKNCIVNNVTMSKRDITPDDNIVSYFPFSYQPNPPTNVISTMLNEIFNPAQKAKFLSFIRECVFGKSTQTILFLLGTGANGKTALSKFLAFFFGSYHVELSTNFLMTTFNKATYDPSNPQPKFGALRGAKVCTIMEPLHNLFDSSLIKVLTGNNFKSLFKINNG